ncbi:LarC family nickel insertion protein [Cyanobium sp. Cruz CV13-4-11]|jgi:pyridinium-3,5-bisthiocarboxylic acid mononucleotide nickel chelatase|uniref:LarC family nickel insertion protein n=1 Tax=unclassified Cyanobium TaxID=2627006 RepID=UPI0020CFD6A6|nr:MULTISPECIES: LarC family nickel insertion protein [unclassified Cyanobium]MCP9900127.1 LarC family nickel insertion protein [Cyanobium sp. Cruz CV11-17]MCP9919225.1 LarC family nickel insertion protein [Cyanobium sp. Cruz CV13-4-11]
MTLALLDCPTGLAGNMLLAALLDLGLPEATIEAPLAALGLEGRYRLRIEERRSGGLRGLHLDVEALEAQPHHRPWGALRQQIQAARLAPALRQKVLAVFGLLAEAEASVHGQAAEAVAFHEVGAIDALVDIVGVCAGLLHLGVEHLVCGVPPAGHGSVTTAHGALPLPAPAVLEIARSRGLPLASSQGFPPGELTTPTGLALMACWADRFGPSPGAVPLRVGVGLGTRQLDRANLLRLTLARPLGDDGASGANEVSEVLLQQQAQIDDASAEDLAYLAEALRQGGALEVFSQPVAMKKGRTGTLLTALMPPELGPALRQVWWCHGTTLGVREQLQNRWILPRHSATLATALGPVRIKWASLPDGRRRAKAEHADLVELAGRLGRSIEEVRDEVRRALASEGETP